MAVNHKINNESKYSPRRLNAGFLRSLFEISQIPPASSYVPLEVHVFPFEKH